jgi:hypothetical protein
MVLALAHPAFAQQPANSAELTRVAGRVEILRKGQTQWIPAVVGAHLVEGDDIRAFSGASAELALPDGSTVVLAENSRLLLTKLEVDRQKQSRMVLLHLAVGKLKATIAQAAITLVRARQSNFAISTPTAVAAARGTIVWVGFDPNTGSFFAVEPERRGLLPSRIDCIPLRGVPAGGPLRGQTVFAGSQSTDCQPAVPIQTQFLTLSNPATAGAAALIGGPVAPPPRALEAVTASLTGPAAPGVTFTTTGAPGVGVTPSPIGQDIVANQQQSQGAQQVILPLSGE